MNRGQRIKSVLSGIIMMIAAMLLVIYKRHAYEIILLVMSFGFTCSGIGKIIYYISMARHMVDGKIILYRGIILFNFGVLSSSLSYVPRIYILLYLACVHAFSGLVEILRTKETRAYGGNAWRLKLMSGIINIVLALFCILFYKVENTAVYIYCLGLLYAGFARIVAAFRRTTFMFIR
ncbi:DUF308 domain-containing protein [Butyrivibrio sp. XPD2002]|uniref:DUF308 domain-containing protein n=1 Tax=Butyrivibrio sp. XPD2002 TaxID=1280665 RepID=UPI0004793A07|nr:DUF308 domain-containing protein [Butyrivibrio sp. XPD2002]